MTPAAAELLERVKRGERILKGQEDKAAARELFRAGLLRWEQVPRSHAVKGWGFGYVLRYA